MAADNARSSDPRRGAGRDRRLDFWRGLFLVDMVLVHLAFEGVDFGSLLHAVIAEHARLAAGGFILVSGLGVGLVFLPRTYAARERADAYRDLWRRAAYVLGIHWVTAASFIALDVARGWRSAATPVSTLARDVLMLRDAPPYGDILPFYVAVLAVSPLLLAAIRRGAWPLVALGSTLVFLWGRAHPWILSPRVGEAFPVVLWQTLFVCGLLGGAALARFDALPPARQRAIAFGSAVAFVTLTLAAAGGIAGDLITFVKVPLSGGEYLRYLTGSLTVVLGSAVGWRWLAPTAVVARIAALGRRSLALYVAHVWVQALLMPLVWYQWVTGAWQILLGPLALVLLAACAWALERVPAFPPAWRRVLRGAGAIPAGAVATLALLAATRMLIPAAPPPTSDVAGAADATPLEHVEATDDATYTVLTLGETRDDGGGEHDPWEDLPAESDHSGPVSWDPHFA